MGVIDDILNFIKVKEMAAIGPYQLTLSTDSQPLLKPDLRHLYKAHTFYVVITDHSGLSSSDTVLIGVKDAEVLPLYSNGDLWSIECPFNNWVDVSQFFAKTSAGTAVITITGTAFPADLMGGR